MPLVTTSEINAAAASAGGGAVAFNVILIEHAEAYARGAEAASTPVIMQISQNCVRYHRDLEPLGRATLAIARNTNVPVAVQLDHAEDDELVRQALALGFTGIMYDGSALPDESNLATTAQIVKACHAAGVPVEAELGQIGGKGGVHVPGARTDPDHAGRFAGATGVDALAVAVGTSHAMTTREAELDYDLIAELKAAVGVPLVLHGSSGVNDEDLVRAVASGITKINIATHLNKTLTEAVRQVLDGDDQLVDPRRYLGAGRDATEVEAVRLLRLLSRDRHGADAGT